MLWDVGLTPPISASSPRPPRCTLFRLADPCARSQTVPRCASMPAFAFFVPFVANSSVDRDLCFRRAGRKCESARQTRRSGRARRHRCQLPRARVRRARRILRRETRHPRRQYRRARSTRDRDHHLARVHRRSLATAAGRTRAPRVDRRAPLKASRPPRSPPLHHHRPPHLLPRHLPRCAAAHSARPDAARRKTRGETAAAVPHDRERRRLRTLAPCADRLRDRRHRHQPALQERRRVRGER